MGRNLEQEQAMNLEESVIAIKELASVSWQWDLSGWLQIVSTLGLTMPDLLSDSEAAKKPYKTYRFASGTLVDAFFTLEILEFVHVRLYRSRIIEGLADSDIDALEADSFHRYRIIIDQIILFLGPPVFDGSFQDDDYPDQISGEYGSMWLLEDVNLVINFVFPENEVGPFIIYGLFTPGHAAESE
jgi:hypothetical protein